MTLADSAVVLGGAALGVGAVLAQGAVVRGHGDGAVVVGAGSAVLENCAVVGRAGGGEVRIGSRTVFGHRCAILGATVGDLCEIGNGSTILPGAVLGDRVFLGERTLVPAGMRLDDGAVAVGRPARVIRTAGEDDLARLAGLRDGDLSVPPPHAQGIVAVGPTHQEATAMGTLYEYRGVRPTVDPTAVLLPSCELTGDVVVGAGTIVGSGVRIIGDSHGPVRIGRDVQILEGTVLHLLPDNELVVEDGVVIGPGSMIHGCHLGAGTVVEPAATICDWAVVGAGCVVKAGSVVKQRDRFGDGVVLDGFPAEVVGTVDAPPALPAWAFHPGDVDTLTEVQR